MNGVANHGVHDTTQSIWKILGERAEKLEKAKEANETERTGQESGPAWKSGLAVADLDEYIPGKEPDSAGLYQLSSDENGRSKIIFDAVSDVPADEDKPSDATGEPEKDQEAEEPEKAGDGGKKTTKCTVNTDKVDNEIKKLKQKKAELEQQIAKAKDDPDEQKKLQNQLTQLDSELKMKDTDSYRRQHAEYRNG